MAKCPSKSDKKKQVDLTQEDGVVVSAHKTNLNRTLRAKGTGVGPEKLAEPTPKPDRKAADVAIQNDNGAEIICTTDGLASKFSGHGGKGHTQSGAIDIIVGRGAGDRKGPRPNIWKRPNVVSDAARMYISAKTDLDATFGLAPGGIGNVRNRSGIALKADHIRIIAREGIKIVTGKMHNAKGTGPGGEKNASGGKFIQPAPPIELIAGNNTEPSNRMGLMVANAISLPDHAAGTKGENGTTTWNAVNKSHSVNGHQSGPGSASPDGRSSTKSTLQPVPVGYNLADCLDDIIQLINNLQSVMLHFAMTQIKLNNRIATHTHIQSVPPGAAIAPSAQLSAGAFDSNLKLLDKVVAGLIDVRYNALTAEMNYTEPFGAKWICSRGVKVSI